MKRLFYSSFFFLLLKYGGLAQSPTFAVARHLTTAQGLSQGQVNCLLKDNEGFIWLGTQDGLNRFDGYRFRHFFHESDDSTTLSNNFIWRIIEDSRHDLWIGTFGGGLCRYDKVTETFQSFHPAPLTPATVSENSIRSICEHPAGTLWAGADKGLWAFDLNTRQFRLPNTALNELINITALFPVSENRLLLGTGTGLFCLDIPTSQLYPVTHSGKPIPAVTSFAEGESGQLWAGAGAGLFLLQKNHLTGLPEVLHSFIHQPTTSRAPVNSIQSLFPERNGILWIGTMTGLARFDTRSPEAGFEMFEHDATDPNSLSNDMVYSLLEPEPGLLWAGTREHVNCIFTVRSPFFNLPSDGYGDGLCSNSVLGMAEDDAGNLWIATKGGLTRIGNFGSEPSNWQMECLNVRNTPTMPFDYVIRIAPAADGALWVTFRRNGFALLKKDSTGKWFFEKNDPFDKLLRGAGINGIYTDKQGITWLATPGQGLFRWNRETGEHRIFNVENTGRTLPHPYIFCVLEDSRGRFWVGTANGGLCLMNREQGTFEPYLHRPGDTASISSNMVLSLMEDSKRRLWVCTANGLNLHLGNGRFYRFSKKDGLPNEVIYGMLEDEDSRLWVSTNRGIACFKAQDDHLADLQLFDVTDGLQGDEFNQHAFYRTRDGRFCFGGTGGLTIFRPSEIRPYPYKPPVVLTDFQLFNQSVAIRQSSDDGRFFLKKSINTIEDIVLRHDQNFIAFEFAALGYTRPENNRYAYRLEGLDEQWMESGQRRYAGYPNLPPGDYIFQVKAANHDGVWNEAPRSVRIKVMPPWWRTWWAYFIFAGMVVLVIYGFFRQRLQTVRQLEKAKAEEREQFRKRIARDFHDEAGNKITKIALLGEVVRNRTRDNQVLQHMLAQLENNIQDLRSGMRDFIWVLDPVNDNLYDTLARLRDFANDLFEHSSTRFSAEAITENLRHVPLDAGQRRHILLIFKEVANNCVRHAGAKQSILRASRSGANLVSIFFSDDGNGFDENTVNEGKGFQNMRDRAEKTGGKLSVSTSPGAGTTVQLDFEITQTGN